MFETRISKSWGVGEGILAKYFLEDLAQDIEGGVLLFVARDKNTGRKVWLKTGDGSGAAINMIESEAEAWGNIKHPNILCPGKLEPTGPDGFIAFPWQGETPLTEYDQAGLSPPDRVRICAGLIEAVAFLQAQEEPISHNSIHQGNVWLKAGLLWPLLFGFQAASPKPSNKDLASDRQACWDTICQVCFSGGKDQKIEGQLEKAANAWLKNGTQKVPGIKAEMGREFIRRVTADL